MKRKRGKGKKPKLHEQEDKIVSFYKSGESTTTIAKRFGVSPNTVGAVLHEQKIKLKRRSKLNGEKDKITASYKSGETTSMIAERYAVSGRTIFSFLQKSGAQLRSRSENMKLAWETGRCPRKLGKESPNWRGGRTYSCGYVDIYCPDHPRARGRRVAEHVLVAEKKLGRFLKPGEVAHHINSIPDDNRPENIDVLLAGEHTHQHLSKLLPRKDEIIKLYIEEKFSITEIAEKLNCWPSNVSVFLHRYGIALRPRGRPREPRRKK